LVMSSTPYITAGMPGTGGSIKTHPDDFRVEEIPLYPFAGVGEHAYLLIEKKGTSTYNAISILAKAIGRRSVDFGFAGLKDAQAVTRQWISIEHEPNTRFEKLEMPVIRIVEQTRHRNKLKLGHLAGNRFTVRIRHEDWDKSPATLQTAFDRAHAILNALTVSGVPNFFGQQRFGMRLDNHRLGMALLKNDAKKFMELWLGSADESVDRGGVLQARRHYDAGNIAAAYSAWPGHLRAERAALAILQKSPGHHAKALHAVDIRLRRLLISSLQAHLFNKVLEARLAQLTTLVDGDLAWLHATGAVFDVTQANLPQEQLRCDRHEISPSGPLFGYRMTGPRGKPGEIEASVLSAAGITPDDFRQAGPQKAKGARRAMRFFFTDHKLTMGRDERSGYLELAFTLPAGSFATVLLGEIIKAPLSLAPEM
jgi:tRNA pseudouridine13 synthase